MAEKHATLSASGAHRWMECTKSIGLEDHFEKEETSVFAEEGTLAHAVAEAMLRDQLQTDSKIKWPKFDNVMREYVRMYVDYCRDLHTQAVLAGKDFTALIEERVNFDQWVPEGFGTNDFMLITAEKLIVIDLKYGKGIKVEALKNSQLRLYALGGIQEYGWIYPFQTIEMHIVQPRLNHISVEVMSRKGLEQWAEDTLVKKANQAMTGEGEYTPGDHCRWCKARATCSARAYSMLDIIQNIIKGEKDKNV